MHTVECVHSLEYGVFTSFCIFACVLFFGASVAAAVACLLLMTDSFTWPKRHLLITRDEAKSHSGHKDFVLSRACVCGINFPNPHSAATAIQKRHIDNFAEAEALIQCTGVSKVRRTAAKLGDAGQKICMEQMHPID